MSYFAIFLFVFSLFIVYNFFSFFFFKVADQQNINSIFVTSKSTRRRKSTKEKQDEQKLLCGSPQKVTLEWNLRKAREMRQALGSSYLLYRGSIWVTGRVKRYLIFHLPAKIICKSYNNINLMKWYLH